MSNLIFLGQWVALTTGALAIFLVIIQTFKACIKEIQRRSRGLSQVEPDEERGADGYVKDTRYSQDWKSSSASAANVPPKKENLLDQPPASLPPLKQSGKLDSRPARERSPERSFEITSDSESSAPPKLDVKPSTSSPIEETPPQSTQQPPKEDSPEPLESSQEAPAVALPPKLEEHSEPACKPESSAPPSKAEAPPADDNSKAPEEAAANAKSEENAAEGKTMTSSGNLTSASKTAGVSPVSTPPVLPKPQTIEPLDVPKSQPSASPQSPAVARSPETALPSRKAETHTLPFIGGNSFTATFTMDDQALGFELRFVGGCPVVSRVVDRSPASVKGVSVQNRALAVNGVPLRGPWPLRKMSKQQWLASVFSSRPLTITFEQTPSKAAGVTDALTQAMSPARQMALRNFPEQILC
eukprot:gnl/MRDRNA2_/MRDRNA2_119284_c0_seq1.p1 gnl/MRDRNA2_/MRDRNA2_119284_c0~~gnl/MRDRNA2_/MRDRNA2_119284_c0_seq1.p1  ORF type:complete len:414 (+),score=93.60 gnl/MRDRNA2_/MRDRNA2_119284_c0_seq1:68-1309(+)